MPELTELAFRLLKEAVEEQKDIKAPSLSASAGEEQRRRSMAIRELEAANFVHRKKRGGAIYVVTTKGVRYIESLRNRRHPFSGMVVR